MQRTARRDPSLLVIGVDASADGLRDVARRLATKPARGGLANAVLGVLPLEQAPGELAGLADVLTVLLPWGSLLHAVARPDLPSLMRLRGLCKPGAELRIVFGHGGGDVSAVRALPDPHDPGHQQRLRCHYRQAGFEVTASPIACDDVARLETTWAGKLAFSGSDRRFLELRGHALDTARDREPAA